MHHDNQGKVTAMPDQPEEHDTLDNEKVPHAADGDDIVGPVSDRPQLPRRTD